MKKRKAFKLIASLTLVLLVIVGDAGRVVFADEPYESYNFNYWGEEVLQPYPYLYDGEITNAELGLNLSYPEDMVLANGKFYIADTGNSRIVICDKDGKVERLLTEASSSEDLLSQPKGVCLDDEGCLYVADFGNERVVKYDRDLNYVMEIGRPVTELILPGQEYKPMKVGVDKSNRIYVIAYGINLGLVEFDKFGDFQGFMGAAEVAVSQFQYIWKNYLSTEEQQARMETIVPTEYSNIFVDNENFIFATIANNTAEDLANGADSVRRLNPTGTDVLRRLANYDIIGDINYRDGAGCSSFCDVAAVDYGCYFLLDNNNGKIFVYDFDGNSLFVFGKKGNLKGNFQKPAAIALEDDAERIYVLDRILGNIMMFNITDYGRNVLEAIRLNDIGDSDGSDARWKEVLERNSNFEMAYVGLGKTYMNEMNYKQAMEYFRLGNSRTYYTKAFYYFRKDLMESYFGMCMLVLILILLGVGVVKGIKNYKKWEEKVRCFMAKH